MSRLPTHSSSISNGVAPVNKNATREQSVETLACWRNDVPLGVRVNGIDTTQGITDVKAPVDADTPRVRHRPGLRGPGDVQIVDEMLDGTNIKLLPVIE